MFPIPDNISTLRKARFARAFPAVLAVLAFPVVPAVLAACSAAPVKMECREIQMRIDYGDLTGDQLRFAMQELDACRGRLKAAEEKDSALVEGTEKRFTPEEP